jgi:hypothetical protein
MFKKSAKSEMVTGRLVDFKKKPLFQNLMIFHGLLEFLAKNGQQVSFKNAKIHKP